MPEAFKLIAHRGNLYGEGGSKWENHPDYIEDAIQQDYDCEIDLWFDRYDRKYLLGHDRPQFEVEYDWLLANRRWLWIHCKNSAALESMHRYPICNFFSHDKDPYTLTSKGYVWAYPTAEFVDGMIIAVPEMHYGNDIYTVISALQSTRIGGICSDQVAKYKPFLTKDENKNS